MMWVVRRLKGTMKRRSLGTIFQPRNPVIAGGLNAKSVRLNADAYAEPHPADA